jgi:competence protein ComEA
MRTLILSWLASRVWLAPGWRRLLLIAALPALAAAGLASVLFFTAPPPSARPAAPPAPGGADTAEGGTLPAPRGLLVDVTGAVARPGVYRVTKGERVSAAIAAAGGLAADADPNRLPSLAAPLRDGQQIRVPHLGAASRTTGTAAGAPRTATVSLNAASAQELAAVPGFTPELAAAVIRHRTEYGGFASTRELVDVLNMSQADYLLARRSLRL